MKHMLSRFALAIAIAAVPIAVYATTFTPGEPNLPPTGEQVPISELDLESDVHGGFIEGKGYFVVKDGMAVFYSDQHGPLMVPEAE